MNCGTALFASLIRRRFQILALFGKLVQRETKAESSFARTETWLGLGTTRRAATTRRTGPRTSTPHTAISFIRSLRIDHVILQKNPVPILAPLRDIAVHVIQSKSVCLETPDG